MTVVLGRASASTTATGGHHRWRHDRRFGCSVQMDEIPGTNNNDDSNNVDTTLDACLADDDTDDDEMKDLLSFRAFSKYRT